MIDEYNKEALKEYGKLLEKMEMYEEAIRTYEKLSMLESENFAYNEKIKNLKMIQDKK